MPMVENLEKFENPQKKSRGQRGKGKGVRADHRMSVYSVAAALVMEPFSPPQRLAEIAWPELTGTRGRKTAHERVRRGLADLAENPELADTLADPVRAVFLAREANEKKIANDRESKQSSDATKKRSKAYLKMLKVARAKQMMLEKAKTRYVMSRLDDAAMKGIRIGKWQRAPFGSLCKECRKIMKIARSFDQYVSQTDVQNRIVGQDAEAVNAAQNRATIIKVAESEWRSGCLQRVDGGV